eukprot:GSMAST32.ASY1.ANO1.1885.1 assembled CDS
MPIIYHEKQQAALCGQHCLNNLVQGPLFDISSLADIAHTLDAEEKNLMLQAGAQTPEALRFLAQDSVNVDNSGNFSVQVLGVALRRVCGCRLSDSEHEDEKAAGTMKNPLAEEAFVLNLHSHWFTIRKLYGKWWNLNSLNSKPEKISEFYLETYLASLRQEKWRIFLVRGGLPSPEAFGFGVNGTGPNFYNISDLDNPSTSEEANTSTTWGVGRTLGGGTNQTTEESDAQLARALQESMTEYSSNTKFHTNSIHSIDSTDSMDSDHQSTSIAQAIALSMEDKNSTAGQNNGTETSSIASTDENITAALELSCQLQLQNLQESVRQATAPSNFRVNIQFDSEIGCSTIEKCFETCGVFFDYVTDTVATSFLEKGFSVVDALQLGTSCKVRTKYPRIAISRPLNQNDRQIRLDSIGLNEASVIVTLK